MVRRPSRIVNFRHSWRGRKRLMLAPNAQVSITYRESLTRGAGARVGLVGSAQAQVSCFVSADPAINALQLMSSRDATATLPRIDAELNATRGLPELDLNRTASLYAVRATTYQVLELDGDARSAALEGLQLVPDVNNPVHVELLSVHSENVYDQAGIDDGDQGHRSRAVAPEGRFRRGVVPAHHARHTAVSAGPRGPRDRQPHARLSNRRDPRAPGTAHDRRVRVVQGDARHGRLHAGAGAERRSRRVEYRAERLPQSVGIPIPARLDPQGTAQLSGGDRGVREGPRIERDAR